MLPAKFGSIWPSSFRGEDFLTLANQKLPHDKVSPENKMPIILFIGNL
jgi:hypothetical protein